MTAYFWLAGLLAAAVALGGLYERLRLCSRLRRCAQSGAAVSVCGERFVLVATED